MKRRAADEIAEDLRSRIVSGELERGGRLPSERALASRYAVSGPTIREALQGLSALGLVDVRHGSGTYVSALADRLVARSLGTLIELEGVSIVDAIGLLGALTSYAARLSIERAEASDIAALRSTIDDLAAAASIEQIVQAVKAFVSGLAACARDPLLLALVRFLLDVQFAVVLQHVEDDFPTWRRRIDALQPDRIAIVDALRDRDALAYAQRIEAFHAHTAELIRPLAAPSRK